jgi:hypothetical protein
LNRKGILSTNSPTPTNNDASVIDSNSNNISGIDASNNNEAIPFVVGQKIMAKDSLNKWFVASHHQYESCIQIDMLKKIIQSIM